LRIATRGSDLARWQADHVAALLRQAHGVDAELVVVDTTGDRRQDVPLWTMGGKGVFVKEVQAAVLDGRADLAVHSGKDLPSIEHPGLTLAAIPERGDPRDALVGSTLAGLPAGAVVATGSVRRRAQLADLRPDLTFVGLRGNMATRIARAGDVGAVVVAAVALERLGLSDRISEILDPAVLVPQVAQGALAVECRSDDREARELLAALDHRPSRLAVTAERAYLAELGGGCDLPAGAHATVAPDGTLRLEALLASLDGRVILRYCPAPVSAATSDETVTVDAAVALGGSAARHLLDRAGGRGLLQDVFDSVPSR
jgi:hydroxymethylbilane synthase